MNFSIYKDIICDWNDIKKVKTSYNDSIILNQSERVNEFLQKLYEWPSYNKNRIIII